MRIDVLTMRAAMHGNLEAQSRLFNGMFATKTGRSAAYPSKPAITRSSADMPKSSDQVKVSPEPGEFKLETRLGEMSKLDDESFEKEFKQRITAATQKERKP